MMLTPTQGRILLRLARQTIVARLGLDIENPLSDLELNDPVLEEKRGVFVTLNKRNRLRGCIGSLTGEESIVEGVRRHSINAAFNDHRFPPVTADEVNDINIEISILTPPLPLAYRDGDDLIRRLRPGRDGVILQDPDSGRGATFLPQVWEQLPRPETFLSHLCRKAGLAETAWQDGRLAVRTYQVQHIQESA